MRYHYVIPPLPQDASPLCENVQSIVSLLLPRVVSTVDFSYSCNSARQAMLDLHSKDKTVDYTDNLMVCSAHKILMVNSSKCSWFIVQIFFHFAIIKVTNSLSQEWL